jgi:acetoin utilization protein AcuB
LKVSKMMKSAAVIIAPEASIGSAIKIMEEKRFRRLPVVKDGNLVGIITDLDIRKALNSPFVFHEALYDEYLQNEIKVEACMTANPLTVSPDSDILDAAVIMREEKIGGLPVVEGNRLVGIITVSDLIEMLIGLLRKKKQA